MSGGLGICTLPHHGAVSVISEVPGFTPACFVSSDSLFGQQSCGFIFKRRGPVTTQHQTQSQHPKRNREDHSLYHTVSFSVLPASPFQLSSVPVSLFTPYLAVCQIFPFYFSLRYKETIPGLFSRTLSHYMHWAEDMHWIFERSYGCENSIIYVTMTEPTLFSWPGVGVGVSQARDRDRPQLVPAYQNLSASERREKKSLFLRSISSFSYI